MRGGEFAEEGGEAELVAVVEVLVAEEERLVGEERSVDLRHERGVQRGGQVNAEDLGADPAADAADVDPGAGA